MVETGIRATETDGRKILSAYSEDEDAVLQGDQIRRTTVLSGRDAIPCTRYEEANADAID